MTSAGTRRAAALLLDPPTGMLAGVLLGKVKDGVETGVRENLKMAKTRLAKP